MSGTESTPGHGMAGHPATASGDRGNPSAREARRREILRADPYYPHTGQRAIAAWLLYFFCFLGFSALLILAIPSRDLEWANVFSPAMIATVSVASQLFCRKARVQMLERTGQIAPEGAAPGAGPRG